MSIQRIADTFQRCRDQGRAAFVGYICAGDPDPETSFKVASTLIQNGVDILELGIPFSDPLADGLTNQLAAQRALESGMTTAKTWELTKALRKEFPDTPLIYYCYFNQVFAREPETFLRESKEAGVDGLLILDLPPEESEEVRSLCTQLDLANVFIIAPTTSDQRLDKIAKVATGFLYYVSRVGVTGVRDDLASGMAEVITRIRHASDLPLVVGFGVSRPEHVRGIAALADGAVVGSALVNCVAASPKDPEKILQSLTTVMGNLTPALKH